MCDEIWRTSKYFRGSISTEIPYEVEYALNIALEDWVPDNCVITTALLDDKLSYHFNPVDAWKRINILLPDFEYTKFNGLLIQIALPRIYKHKPLYYIPLYHELGHFIDVNFGITQMTLISHPPDPAQNRQSEISYRQEFFADLFAACYVGEENYKLLKKLSPSSASNHTPTHPSTNFRMQLALDFLSEKDNEIVNLFQDTLNKLGLPKLEKKYVIPDLSETFGNLRPYTIQNNQELHGILEAAWTFFDEAIKKKLLPWSNIEESDISKIINDLTEKSIRNKVIQEKWKSAIT